MKKLQFIFAAVIYFAITAQAHEGHGIPGALPAAPHGGIVKEAEHAVKVVHQAGKEEPELFFEAVYKDKEVRVYPLVLATAESKVFSPLSPTKLEKTTLKVELPRLKKTQDLKLESHEEYLKASFDAKGTSRFILHVSVEHEKEMKTAKLQLERY